MSETGLNQPSQKMRIRLVPRLLGKLPKVAVLGSATATHTNIVFIISMVVSKYIERCDYNYLFPCPPHIYLQQPSVQLECIQKG